MSATKSILAAASLAVMFASGFASAAPHPQTVGAGNAGHKALVDAAKRVHINGQARPKVLSSTI